jgi:hypothetical protein
MENKLQWQSVTQSLYQAILINVCCSIAAAVFAILSVVTLGLGSVLSILAAIGVIVAQVLFFLRIGAWRDIAAEPDKKAIGNIRTAMILSIVAGVISLIPLVGAIIGGILAIVALVMQLMGYSALKNSATMPTNAKVGAGKVFTSQILAIAAAVIGIIPVAGVIISAIVEIVAFVLMLQGWKLIANSAE